MNESGFFYPQKMGRIILRSMEEVISRNGLSGLLRLASLDSLIDNYPPSRADRKFPFETISLLQRMLEQAYGTRGGRGLALRIGRASFKYGLKEYGSGLGFTATAFRLLPLSTKLRSGLKSLAELFNQNTDQRVRIDEQDDQILWRVERCPLCWERRTEEPVCHLAVGLLQEALYWLSGGKTFNVEETTCVARGDPACTIRIDRTPIS
jgi:predicted hydrocarbon binding protein